MKIEVGQTIPEARVFIMSEQGPQAVTTNELLGQGKTALFALPGAFTPTCSALHVPGFLAQAEAFKQRGIDRIVCLSVNDPFVMMAWGEQQNVQDKILMVGDGNAELTLALGLEVDRSDVGMGMRSQRYSMLIDNGVLQQLNIEQAGQFEVSDANTLLAQL